MPLNLPTDTSQARGAEAVRRAATAPGGLECLLEGLFGGVEVAEKAYQRCQNSTRLAAIEIGHLSLNARVGSILRTRL